jgi:hypothetical protein
MAVTAMNLIEAKYASNSDTTEYTAPTGTRTIIDKFTATNVDASARTISINIVSSGGSVGSSNLIMKTTSISAGDTYDFTEIQNQILNEGDSISCVASAGSAIVIRASGRECT